MFTPPNSKKGANQFAFEGVSEKCSLVLVDEFLFSNFDLQMWKLFVAGDKFVTNRKFGSAKTKQVQCPMIFISQVSLDECLGEYPEPGIKERLFVVKADGPPYKNVYLFYKLW